MGRLNYTTEKTNELLEKVDDMPEEVKDGKTPVLETGTTTTLAPGQNATSEVVANGTDSAGNPKYKLNFGIPKGYDGAGGSGGGSVADSVQWANVLNKPSWVNSSTKPAYTASEVGALPANTQIPSKTSQLTNDSGFTTSKSFKTINGQSIVGSGNIVIESGGGGGGDTPSAGGGNVNVTNESVLKSADYYAFKPSADGSLNGTFSVIPEANENRTGLMSSSDKAKLNNMKANFTLSFAAASLTDNSTSDEILQVFKPTLNSIGEVMYLILAYSSVYNAEYNTDMLNFYIGNIRTDTEFIYNDADNTGTMKLTWVNSGTLKTLTITATQEALSCKVTEMGGGADNTYYLSNDVYDLSSDATHEDILKALGGEGALNEIAQAVKDKRKLCIYYNLLNIMNGIFYVNAYVIGTTVLNIEYLNYSLSSRRYYIKYVNCNASENTQSGVRIFYPNGYELKPEVYNLSSSSASEDISIAVGGESGLKDIIQAVKDGNRLVINAEENGVTQQVELLSPIFSISENGDISLAYTINRFEIIAFETKGCVIAYTKSSNTFSFNSVDA